VIDSPFVLAGIVVVVVAIVGGIVATIVRTRNENSFSMPSKGLSYEPPPDAGDPDDPESADLSRLDALVSVPAAATTLAPPPDEPLDLPPPPPVAEAFAPDVVDEPERDEEPLAELWSHLVTTEEGPLDVNDRLDMVARLEMVGEKWCVDALASAANEEKDPQVNAAVRAALARIAR
jgi:hypothetical protein